MFLPMISTTNEMMDHVVKGVSQYPEEKDYILGCIFQSQRKPTYIPLTRGQ
jgi:hypothetical protein